MRSEEVAVVGYGLFVPGFAGVPAWTKGVYDAAQSAPLALSIPARQRRRTSTLTKALADAYAEALAMANLAAPEVASVFASALGEASTMLGLLEQLWSEEGLLSPQRFVTSVHNAAAGVVSIAGGNQGFSTSLGADYDTPAMALAEGIGLVLAEGAAVVVCCGDEGISGDLVPAGKGWELMAAAIALVPSERAPTAAPRLRLEEGPVYGEADDADSSERWAPLALSHELASNPCVGLLELVDALARDKQGSVRLDRGQGAGYVAHLHRGKGSELRAGDPGSAERGVAP